MGEDVGRREGWGAHFWQLGCGGECWEREIGRWKGGFRGLLRETGRQDGSDAGQNHSVGVLARLETVRGGSARVQWEIATAQGQVATAQGQVATAQGRVATVQGRVATVQGRVATVQWEVATVQNQVALVQNYVATLQGLDATVQNQVATVQGLAAVRQGMMDPRARGDCRGSGDDGAAVVRTGEFDHLKVEGGIPAGMLWDAGGWVPGCRSCLARPRANGCVPAGDLGVGD